MALDLVAIRQGLAARIRDGVSREINVYDGYVPANPSPPCVIITPAPAYIEFGQTFRDPRCAVELLVWVLAAPGVETDGQRLLDQFLSRGAGQQNSIYDAIQIDPTLGGVIPRESLVVTGAEYLNRFLFGDAAGALDWASISVSISVS
jgi:hypothetical protein